jgi:hypothetical protein
MFQPSTTVEPGRSIWHLNGTHGDMWRNQRLTVVPQVSRFQLVLEGVKGSGYYSDIALDDLKIESGHC